MSDLIGHSEGKGILLRRPVRLLRAEGVVAAVFAVLLYRDTGESWLLFALLALAPNLSMLGYLGSTRLGTVTYNVFHTVVLPLLLAAVGIARNDDHLIAVSLIWLTHIAVDRALGYGLKSPTGFKDSHLTSPSPTD